jgi:hypothetical protein
MAGRRVLSNGKLGISSFRVADIFLKLGASFGLINAKLKPTLLARAVLPLL